MPRVAKAHRRSFRVGDEENEAPPEDDLENELRTRRSINRVEGGPVFRSPSKRVLAPQNEDSNDFFHCLKLAAENKISSKNAFGLQMIDFLGDQLKHKDSAISTNFQLATCSLDAGTKIYAARVDCVAKNVTDFTMVMAMANKKGGVGDPNADDDNVENEDPNTRAKKKTKRKRGNVFAKSTKELQLDLGKMSEANSVYPVVGNLMQESLDTFTFNQRCIGGAIPELKLQELEFTEDNKAIKITIPKIPPESTLCETLRKFALEFELSESVNDLLNCSMSSMSESPANNISLKEFNASPLRDDPTLESFHNDDASVIDEGRDAFLGGMDRESELVADRSSVHTGPMVAKKCLHSGRIIQLQGPTFWKWKKPLMIAAAKNVAPKKAGPKHAPIDLDANVDLTKLLKKKTKVVLQRDTMVKWLTSKITMPFEISEADPSGPESDITKYSLMPSKSIPNQEALEPAKEDDADESRIAADDFFNAQKFPDDNEVVPPDDVDNNYDGSDYEQDNIDEGDENFTMDLANLFKNSAMGDTKASFMTNFGLDESNLITAPDVIETVMPEWKPARRFNMKKLEATLWEHIEVEQDGTVIKAEPTLTELYESLPEKTQHSASVGTVLYALLNVANKRCLAVNGEEVRVQHLPKPPNAPHPAISPNGV